MEPIRLIESLLEIIVAAITIYTFTRNLLNQSDQHIKPDDDNDRNNSPSLPISDRILEGRIENKKNTAN